MFTVVLCYYYNNNKKQLTEIYQKIQFAESPDGIIFKGIYTILN